MFCSSVKPQKQLQKQHGTNSTGNTYDTKMVWLSAPCSRRQPPRHRQGTRTCHSQTLGFGLPGGGRCAAYHPPFYTQRSFQHCCLCLQSRCRREVCDHQDPARMLCCSTVTVGFTSATSLCGNEVLPQAQSCSSAAETLVTEQKGFCCATYTCLSAGCATLLGLPVTIASNLSHLDTEDLCNSCPLLQQDDLLHQTPPQGDKKSSEL